MKEFPDDATVVMQTIWPNLIVQQQSNTLALRQIQPRDPGSFELHWTFFGYADDDEAMTLRRLRQANLMSAAGLVSADDSEVIKLAQDGIEGGGPGSGMMLMGGRGTADETAHGDRGGAAGVLPPLPAGDGALMDAGAQARDRGSLRASTPALSTTGRWTPGPSLFTRDSACTW